MSLMRRSRPAEPKGQNFSFHEKLLVLDLIAEHGRGLVEENETLSLFRRSRIWRHIHTEFSQHQGVGQRTEKQLRLLWKNLKARCKREFRLNNPKYRGPNCYIQDPLLRKMSTLIGVEDDTPKQARGLYQNGAGVRRVMRLPPGVTGRLDACRPKIAKSAHSRLDQNLFLDETGSSHIQIAKTFSIVPAPMTTPNRQEPVAMAGREQVSLSVPAPVSGAGISGLQPHTGRDPANYLTEPNLDQVQALASPQREDQIRSPHGVDSTKSRPPSESVPSRRKKAVPRKASEMIKSELDDQDDVIQVEDCEDVHLEFIAENGDTEDQTHEEEWVEETTEQPTECTPTRFLDTSSSSNVHARGTYRSGLVPLNNLHHQLPVRQSRPSIRNHVQASTGAYTTQREREQRPLTVNEEEPYTIPEDSERTGGETSERTPAASDVAAEKGSVTPSDLHAETLEMARQEHDVKMATMLMKRKQIMQIKRREHLAKMENYRLSKDILRLKKRKLELEIKNSMYLDEVEDNMDG